MCCCPTVISLSKIENLKAIHNDEVYWSDRDGTVISLSKIENLKAIHNLRELHIARHELLSVCQR